MEVIVSSKTSLISFLLMNSKKVVKGQALANFLVEHPYLDVMRFKGGLEVNEIEINPWVLKFDSSSTETSTRARVLIESLTKAKTALSFNLDFKCTNNQVEYKALLIGLEILLELGAKRVKVMGDS
ncbi:hypothetical protein GH714_040494 [Hevea brasiliensis]|uniref:RNase H type-1 domain-containing protein n=1 Tax=Hevea brasiliensis TaxID=3981 RepID=A0A6A6MTV1_HEVBR|nr:hypothetical protein GH714_040494 [Hevea brasiliensis]